MAILSPYFSPDHGGLADHSALLAGQLLKDGHQVTIFSGTKLVTNNSHASFYFLPRPWGRKTYKAISLRLETEQFDLLIIQYTPLSFAPKLLGFSLFLPWYLHHWHRQMAVIFYAHEANYPIEWSLKGLILGCSHVLQFFIQASFLNHIIFSHESSRSYWSRLLPWRKKFLHVLPIFSNIPVLTSEKEVQVWGLKPGDVLLCYFGGTHCSVQTDFLIRALGKVCESKKYEVKLLMVGTMRADWGERGQALDQPNIVFTGRLSAEDVSFLLSKAKLILLPFDDGVSARRGSFMAALAHGKAIATTRGRNTLADLPWNTICFLAPSNDPEQYASMVLGMLDNDRQMQDIANAGKQFYDQHFSLATTAEYFHKNLRPR